MAKNGVFKKITSLAMAIALVVCFAVSASAVNVLTTTTYVGEVDSVEYIDVTVQVTDAGANNNVAYYATNSTGDVHIDQEKADGDGNATFNYRTEYANLATTSAKIGVTGASSAVDNDDTKVDGYAVTLVRDGSTLGVKNVANEGELTVTFDYTATTGKVFKDVTVSDNADVASADDNENGTLTVIFNSITGDVTLTVVEENAVTTTANATLIERAAVVSTGKVDGAYDEEGNDVKDTVKADKGDIKLTVIGKATDASEYGILVSKTAISGYDANIAYEGITILTEEDTERGYAKDVFAVQIIDTSATGEILEAGGKCYVAVYAKDKVTNEYVVSAASEVEIPAAAAEETN